MNGEFVSVMSYGIQEDKVPVYVYVYVCVCVCVCVCVSLSCPLSPSPVLFCTLFACRLKLWGGYD